MAKKKYFKKKAVLQAISKYQRRKINYITLLSFTSNQMLIDGKAQLPLQDVLSAASGEYLTLGRQYSQVKIRGLSIKVNNISEGSGSPVFVLGVLQANDDDSFAAIRTQSHVLMLDTKNPVREYVKIDGGFNATNSTDNINNIKIVPQYTGNLSSGAYYFAVKICLYLTFKSNL